MLCQKISSSKNPKKSTILIFKSDFSKGMNLRLSSLDHKSLSMAWLLSYKNSWRIWKEKFGNTIFHCQTNNLISSKKTKNYTNKLKINGKLPSNVIEITQSPLLLIWSHMIPQMKISQKKPLCFKNNSTLNICNKIPSFSSETVKNSNP